MHNHTNNKNNNIIINIITIKTKLQSLQHCMNTTHHSYKNKIKFEQYAIVI